MRAQELRIGNYVDTPVGVKRVVSIVSSADGSIYDIRTATRAISGEENLFIDCELAPIPLTEELLLKCGFKVERESGMSKHYYTNKKILLIDNQNDSYDPCLLCDYRGGSEDFPADKWFERYGVTISYLHQLQNLYFALTGDELDVKL